MVREIITIQAGKCGCSIGSEFFNVMSASGTTESVVKRFFDEKANKDCVPRSVLISRDQAFLGGVRDRMKKNIYAPENFFISDNRKKTWQQTIDAYENEKWELSDLIHAQAEKCDCFCGFQFIGSCFSVDGGGLGSMLLRDLHDEYADRPIITYNLYPSSDVEKIKFSLAHKAFIESSSLAVFFDNEIKDDYIIGKAIATINSGNYDLRRIVQTMVPFESQKMATLSRAEGEKCSEDIFDNNNSLFAWGNQKVDFSSAFAVVRGGTEEMIKEMLNVQSSNQAMQKKWPDIIQSEMSCFSPTELSCSALVNGMQLIKPLSNLCSSAQNAWASKPSKIWEMSEGIFSNQITNALQFLENEIEDSKGNFDGFSFSQSNGRICIGK